MAANDAGSDSDDYECEERPPPSQPAGGVDQVNTALDRQAGRLQPGQAGAGQQVAAAASGGSSSSGSQQRRRQQASHARAVERRLAGLPAYVHDIAKLSVGAVRVDYAVRRQPGVADEGAGGGVAGGGV